MSYRCTLSNSIRPTNLEDWEQLCQPGGDLFMDPRFLEVVETSMAGDVRFWNVIVYDDRGRPAASACVSLLRVDAALLTQGRTRMVVRAVRRLLPGFLYFRVLCLGLPFSASQSHLRVREDADIGEVLRVLDGVLVDLARRHRAPLIVLKEFDPREAQRLEGLENLGYLRADSLPTHHLKGRYGSFDGLCAALRSKYRRNIRGSRRKFERSGLEVVHVTGGEGADRLFSDDLHRLYLVVLEHAKVSLERLPAEFFRAFCRHLGDQAVLTLVGREDRVVAWCLSLLSPPAFYMLVMGMDYEAKAIGDLYFNVIFETLDYGMRRGATEVWIGPNSEAFKARLGCRQEARCVYVKGRGIVGRVLPAVAGRFFPAVSLSRGNRAVRCSPAAVLEAVTCQRLPDGGFDAEPSGGKQTP
jgi:hypothetical protein